jgi:hypothetical protein
LFGGSYADSEAKKALQVSHGHLPVVALTMNGVKRESRETVGV